MIWNWTTIAAIFYLLTWVIVIAALFVVPVNRKPSSATAWLMLIFLVPFIGLLIFLLIGSPKLSRARRAKQRKMDDLIAEVVTNLRSRPELAPLIDPPIPERYQPFVALNHALSGMPAFAGNTVDVLSDYAGTIQAIATDIDRAERFVHVEFFCLNRDPETEVFFVAIEQAVARGVKVRVLMDHWSSRWYPGYQEMCTRLTAAGIEWHVMLPVQLLDREFSRLDLRNHRKLVVIDNTIGYTGSMNMIRRNYHRKDQLYYDELVARVTGPVVGQLEAVFITDWYSETNVVLDRQTAPEVAYMPVATGAALCQVLPSGPGHDDENNLKLFTSLLHAARRRILVSTPYFVPDDCLMVALTSAAQRGVEVIMLNSEIGDQFMVFHAQHSYYEPLLRAGVKIYLYPTPILLHSKFMTVDDDLAVIGSSNIDIRSFQLDLEVSLICYDQEVVAELHMVEAEYLRRSRPIHLAEWRARPLTTRLFENVTRLTSALQ